MRSVGPRTVYKCIGKINSVKHGDSLVTPFQASLYRVYQSFRCLPSIVSSVGLCYTRVVVRVHVEP